MSNTHPSNELTPKELYEKVHSYEVYYGCNKIYNKNREDEIYRLFSMKHYNEDSRYMKRLLKLLLKHNIKLDYDILYNNFKNNKYKKILDNHNRLLEVLNTLNTLNAIPTNSEIKKIFAVSAVIFTAIIFHILDFSREFMEIYIIFTFIIMACLIPL